jgi:hypothetical protein
MADSFRCLIALSAMEIIIENSACQYWYLCPNPQVGHLIMALNLVIMPIQAKSNFHPMGEEAELCQYRNTQHPQEFQLANLRIWVSFYLLTT